MNRQYLLLVLLLTIIVASCSQRNSSTEQIVQETLAHRSEIDSSFRNDPDSPFNRDTSIRYEGIKWFPPDPQFYFRSKLYQYERPETVIVYGTKGEERTQLKFGYFFLGFDGKDQKLNAYKVIPSDPLQAALNRNQLSVWFTDETTGKETYEVGRYVDVGEETGDTNHIYTINLNNAYNPYCAYSALYSCAIPRKEDHLGFPVRAGEMKYHH
ncbi:MAG: DUF1684 domain-containing protein [Ignavibacteriae bacterium]|nr:DUF1684 domain-containing protein [Ignavibacteria bacterium]MBI3363318.1 DUF1684 domain-containing protein [Ignavibacteriota bacterium]